MAATAAILMPAATVRAQDAEPGSGAEIYLMPPAKLVAKAGELVAQGQHVEALTLLDLATMQVTDNADAWFLLGKVHVEEVSDKDGIAALLKCRALEPKRPELHLLLGRGYLETGRPAKALDALLAEKAISGQTPELAFRLGIAYMDQKRWSQAEQALRGVPDAGTPYSGRKHFNLGLIALNRGQTEAGVAALRRSVREEEEPIRKEAFQTHLAKIDTTQGSGADMSRSILDLRTGKGGALAKRQVSRAKDKRLSATLDVHVEFDDNVAMANASLDDLYVPPRTNDRRDERLVLSGRVDWRASQWGALGTGLRLDLFQSAHADEDQFDYTMATVTPYLEWENGPLTVDLHPSYAVSRLGGDSYENQIGAGVSITYRETDWTHTLLFHRYARREVSLPATPASDRDGDQHKMGVYQTVDVKRLGLRLYAGFEHTWDRTQGSDYDCNTPRLVAGAGLWLPLDIYATAEYSYLHQDYLSPNSYDMAGRRRSDRRDSYTARLSRSITSHVDAYVEYRHMRNSSNVDTFSFVSTVVAAGVVINY